MGIPHNGTSLPFYSILFVRSDSNIDAPIALL